MSQINFQGKTTVELKATAYDLLGHIQQYQQLLQAVNNEIAERIRTEQTNADKPLQAKVVEFEPTEKSPE